MLEVPTDEIIPISGGMAFDFAPVINGAGERARFDGESPFIDKPFLKRRLMGLERRGRKYTSLRLAWQREGRPMIMAIKNSSQDEEDLKRRAGKKEEIGTPKGRPKIMTPEKSRACPREQRKGIEKRRVPLPEKKMRFSHFRSERLASSSSRDRLISRAPRCGEK